MNPYRCLFREPGMPSTLFAPKERSYYNFRVKQVNARVAAKPVRAISERGNIKLCQPFPHQPNQPTSTSQSTLPSQVGNFSAWRENGRRTLIVSTHHFQHHISVGLPWKNQKATCQPPVYQISHFPQAMPISWNLLHIYPIYKPLIPWAGNFASG